MIGAEPDGGKNEILKRRRERWRVDTVTHGRMRVFKLGID